MDESGPIDALILAGGRASEEMARLTGTAVRALFPWRGKPFVQWVYEAVRSSPNVQRIAVVGPPELADVPEVRDADVLVPELDSIEANLFGALAKLLPNGRILVTASDNPLVIGAAYDDFLSRCPPMAAVCYPILRHEAFLRQFPGATNIAIPLRDGSFIGGNCALIHSKSIPRLQHGIRAVLAARKSKREMVGLLGWKFALKLAMKRVTSQQVEDRCSELAGLAIRFIRDCASVFPIDIDDPEDLAYLERWAG